MVVSDSIIVNAIESGLIKFDGRVSKIDEIYDYCDPFSIHLGDMPSKFSNGYFVITILINS
jgi:hypothetical protein